MYIVSEHHLLSALLSGNYQTEMLLLLLAGVAILYAIRLKKQIDKQNKILNERKHINELQGQKIRILNHLLMSLDKKCSISSNTDKPTDDISKQNTTQAEMTGNNGFQQPISAIPLENMQMPIIQQDEFFLMRLLQQLELVYPDTSFNVEKLSENMHISRSHLYRKIKEMSGLSPVEFLRDFRLQKAMMLLKEGKHNISEITYQVGFSSPAYFSKCFKHTFGVSGHLQKCVD